MAPAKHISVQRMRIAHQLCDVRVQLSVASDLCKV